MKRVIIAGLFLLADIVGPAMADSCNSHGGAMTGNQIQALLNPGTNVYACYNPGTGRQNNETLLTGTTSGTFQEYHKGGATVQNEGTYTIAGGTGTGTITYAYTVGGTDIYNICLTASGTNYFFLNSANKLLTIAVTATTSGC